MRRVSLLVTAFLLGLSVLAGMAPASAYPSVSLHITDRHDCCGESNFKVVVTADPQGVVCSTLTVSATNRVRVLKDGNFASSQTWTNIKTPFTVTVRTPDFSGDRFAARTHASCTYDDAQVPQAQGAPGGVMGASVVAAIQTVSTTGALTNANCRAGDDDDDSNGDDDDDHGSLPDTGGERLMWLILGALLLIGGGVTVARSRAEDRKVRT
jgi:LPXTG-motif cell wall-anchored protein